MDRSIEDFVGRIPDLKGWNEAQRIYIEAENVNNFPRIELTG